VHCAYLHDCLGFCVAFGLVSAKWLVEKVVLTCEMLNSTQLNSACQGALTCVTLQTKIVTSNDQLLDHQALELCSASNHHSPVLALSQQLHKISQCVAHFLCLWIYVTTMFAMKLSKNCKCVNSQMQTNLETDHCPFGVLPIRRNWIHRIPIRRNPFCWILKKVQLFCRKKSYSVSSITFLVRTFCCCNSEQSQNS